MQFRIACGFCMYSHTLYIFVQFDLYRKSLIELTAEAPAVTRSRCALTGKRVRLVIWGALGVLSRQCASENPTRVKLLETVLFSNTQLPFQQNLS